MLLLLNMASERIIKVSGKEKKIVFKPEQTLKTPGQSRMINI